MKRVVIDTNVIISSIITPEGNPAKIMQLVSERQICLYYSSLILGEYKRVLAYKKLGIMIYTQERIIAEIKKLGVLIGPIPSKIPMPHEDDRIFYDTAQAGEE